MSVDEGQTIYFEIKGTGSISNQWFEAEQNSEGAFVLTKKGKRDMELKNNKLKPTTAAAAVTAAAVVVVVNLKILDQVLN